MGRPGLRLGEAWAPGRHRPPTPALTLGSCMVRRVGSPPGMSQQAGAGHGPLSPSPRPGVPQWQGTRW